MLGEAELVLNSAVDEQINSLGQGPRAGGDGWDGFSLLLSFYPLLLAFRVCWYQKPAVLGWQLGLRACARGAK